MPSLDTLLAFFGVAIVLGLTPGPDNLFVLMQSAQHGWRTGLQVVIGLCLGIAVHTCAVALGLAAIILTSPTAFTVLKLVGALYLLWLAWGAWRSPANVTPTNAQEDAAPMQHNKPGQRPLAMIGRGFVMNLSNPKVLMFFLAFLPQFANPALGPVPPQIGILGLVFTLATLLVFGAIACFSGFFGSILQKSSTAQRILNRIASVVFAGLAIRLLTMQRLA